MDRSMQSVANRCNHQHGSFYGLRQRLSLHAVLQQHPPAKARAIPQVAAGPPYIDGPHTIKQVGVQVAVEQQQPQQQLEQHNGWLPQVWSSKRHQQQQQQHKKQQGAEQQQQAELQQQHDHLGMKLQQCRHWLQIAAVVNNASQEQQLSLTHVTTALEQLSRSVHASALSQQGRQQLDSLLDTLAEAAVQQVQALHHQEVGQLLARLQMLGFKPSPAWVKSVLQHAGTELVHYTPAELSLLLLTATETAARVPGSAPPPMQLMRSSPTAAAAVVMGSSAAEGLADSSSSSSSSAGGGGSGSTAVRRSNMVLTSAWLQHFMTTFERYLAARTAHPQLQPQHLEAVITCLAALQVTPDRFWLYLFVRQMTAQLPACTPASTVRIMSALASMGYRLPDHVVSQIERQVGGPALAALHPQECVEVVKSVAALKQKPSDAWMQQLLAAALKGSSHLSASAVVTLMVCTAALGIDLNPSWIDCLLMQARAALHVLSAPEHVGLIDALSQQQHRPGPVFMSLYMTQVQAHLPELSLGQQAVLIASLAAVGYKPAPAWMSAFMGQLAGQQVAAADAPELLKLLTGLRRMQYVPTSAVAQQLEEVIDSIAVSLPYSTLQQLRAAVADLQYKPFVPAGAVNSSRGSVGVEIAAAAAAAASTAAAAAADFEASSFDAAIQEADQQQQQESQGQLGGDTVENVDQRQQAPGEQGPSVMRSLELFA